MYQTLPYDQLPQPGQAPLEQQVAEQQKMRRMMQFLPQAQGFGRPPQGQQFNPYMSGDLPPVLPQNPRGQQLPTQMPSMGGFQLRPDSNRQIRYKRKF